MEERIIVENLRQPKSIILLHKHICTVDKNRDNKINIDLKLKMWNNAKNPYTGC